MPHAVSIDDLLAHAGWARRLARRLSRDGAAADDLLQQAWLRAMEAPPAARSAAPGWFATVISNLARDARRREIRRAARERSSARGEAMSTPDLVARAEAERRVIEAVVALDEPYRTAVLLRFYEDVSPAEVARRTGVPPATARTRLHRALAMLRDRLGGPGGALAVLVPPTGTEIAAKSGAARLAGRGVAMGKTTKAAAAALLLLLLGGAAWLASGGSGTPPAPATDGDPGPLASRDAPARARATTVVPLTTGAAADPAATSAPGEGASSAVPADEGNRLKPVLLRWLTPSAPPEGVRVIPEGEMPEMPADAGEKVLDLGAADGGGMQMVGWSEWAPVPVRGPAEWTVRVVDAESRPVPDAMVYRIRPDDAGRRPNPCSFEWIDDVGRTGPDGTVRAARQPEGSFLVAADWRTRMLRDTGLDIGPAEPLLSRASGPNEVTIRLPLDPSRTAVVEGVVRDEAGNPVHRAQVLCGWNDMITRQDGRYRLEGVAAGERRLVVDAVGYAKQTVIVAAEEGRTATVDIALKRAVRGELSLSGRVVDTAGAPIADAPVYLFHEVFEASRWAQTGPDGKFEFEGLPRATRREGIGVMVSPYIDDRDFLEARNDDVRPGDFVELVVERAVKVVVLLRDAATGAPVPLFRGEVRAEREGKAPAQLMSLSQYDESGRIELRAPIGRLVLSIEAKDYRGMEIAADVPDLAGPKELVLSFERP